MAAPGFWDNQEKAQQVVGQLKSLKSLVNPMNDAVSATEDLAALVEMTEDDESSTGEVQAEVTRLEKSPERISAGQADDRFWGVSLAFMDKLVTCGLAEWMIGPDIEVSERFEDVFSGQTSGDRLRHSYLSLVSLASQPFCEQAFA